MLSAPQSVLDTNCKGFKRRPKNLVSETILIEELYNFNSVWSLLLLQKCILKSFNRTLWDLNSNLDVFGMQTFLSWLIYVR